MAIFLILILSTVLRLVSINQSLWLDEAIGALVVKNMSYFDIFTKFSLADNHPPLYYLTLKLWTNYFGYSEIGLRSLSVLFGLGTIYLVYKLTKSKMATLLIATAPLHIYYSQEARMYVMAGFLSILAVYLFIKNKFLLLSLTICALIFTDYVPVFILPVFWIYAILTKKNLAWWKMFLLSHIPLILLGLFWEPVFMFQSESGSRLLQTLPAWQNVAGGATLKQLILFWNKLILGRISFYPKQTYYGLILLSSIPFILSLKKSFKKENLIYWLWFLVPPAIGFVVSFVFPAFIYFRFLFVVPAFYILVSKTKSKLLITLMLLVNLIGWGIYVTDKTQQRENWKEAVYFVESNLKTNEAIVLNYPEPFAPYKWYSTKGNKVISAADSISVNSELTKTKVSKLLQNYKGLYYFNYLEDLTDPNQIVRKELSGYGYKKSKTFSFNSVGEVEYLIKE
ncbi:hypothetical protein A2422_02265 [Candidatus Woesebacteria bacterium RIFOXYC1_FULL_31_51]|nr:MAG: hypothetical protein UR17_C0001G0912 [Candidatus Woesebacteria bacterium GW2011_GWF1_31_35]KKP23545.1 MAG: hypothetical protein UR11_C0001G0519 [Candidatus Woesebacteria bacterium GW2011_GWC1_30_29]KKP25723.1 MAG: hypothetical protein UR13_C0007G0044 [Candidatus Woesebacteria bacterium GW2011_GWD1_31_12]KKP27821.1 MAG: hypothetical protein UR16_C0002G0151 [Candidatus Woesebacteria bacterium GW2011_GWB1_31_29]KKP31775.1 MAG: hypothetical protein UR20_C0032G0004 [Candidatus Woesebacteria 